MDQFEANWLSMEFSAAAAEIETWNEGLKASFEAIVAQTEPDVDPAEPPVVPEG